MRLLSIVFFFLFFILNSCDRIIEENRYDYELENYTSPYQGIWYGTYNGSNINSNFVLTVYKRGNVAVTRSYDNTSETFYGDIYDSGLLNSVQSLTTTFVLIGNLSNKNGTWRQAGTNGGSWSVIKKQ